jgi:hypothetical protein
MFTVLIAFALAQAPGCTPAAIAVQKTAQQHAEAFDLVGARNLLASAAKGCDEALVGATYLTGWIAARAAYAAGGSPESLAPVREAIERLTAGGSPDAKIASFVLQAAAAAAQSERDELALMIGYAVELEERNVIARLPALPLITAHEAAGELWLQVHRYDDARRAYTKAAERIGVTPRITLGFARLAVRIDALATACTQYRSLVTSWKERDSEPPELAEARTFLASSCQR